MPLRGDLELADFHHQALYKAIVAKQRVLDAEQAAKETITQEAKTLEPVMEDALKTTTE